MAVGRRRTAADAAVEMIALFSGEREPMGRPSVLTPQVEERILGFLRLGNYIETACKAAGIHKDTFYDWMKRARTGKPGDERYAEFAARVDSALAEAEGRDVQTILLASRQQWQAAAWRLERRFPERWSRNDRVRVDGNVEVGVSDDGLLGKLARLITSASTPEDPGRADEGGAGAPGVPLGVLGEAQAAPPAGDLADVADPRRKSIRKDQDGGGIRSGGG